MNYKEALLQKIWYLEKELERLIERQDLSVTSYINALTSLYGQVILINEIAGMAKGEDKEVEVKSRKLSDRLLEDIQEV